jgi:hypothetical protein
VALGEQTHKVMGCVHITKSQDKVAQRHERLGTPKIYENMESKKCFFPISNYNPGWFIV